MLAYVGSYSDTASRGVSACAGIRVFSVDSESGALSWLSESVPDVEAGYLCISPDQRYLYAVDERKSDGRGPVGFPATVKAFAVASGAGVLTLRNSQPAFGPFPTYLDIHPNGRLLVTASHGSFDHVERVVKTETGFATEYVYDDSTVALYPVTQQGGLQPAVDVKVFRGHGIDPCDSRQAGGHPQASAHAHSALFDPGGRFVLVCDKGTDQIFSFPVDPVARRFGEPVIYAAPSGSAPRHPAFHPTAALVFVTNELASTVSSFAYDRDAGRLSHLATVRATGPDHTGDNEPADIQVHPGGRFVFVNNRGEDALVGFSLDVASGKLRYASRYSLAKSIHPGLAARSFRFDPTGRFVFVADRPANTVLTLSVDGASGELALVNSVTVPDPAFVLIVP